MSVNTEFIFYITFADSKRHDFAIVFVKAVTVDEAYRQVISKLTMQDYDDINNISFVEVSRMKLYVEGKTY